MNINNDYQKRRGQTTSSPTGEIIEPNKKYLESNSFYPLSNLIYREYLGDTGKLIEGMNLHKKKDPLMGSFMVLPKQVFPCFHCFSKSTPSQVYKLFH